MSYQNTAWRVRRAASPVPTHSCPTWLANLLLGLASGVLLGLACAAAWLSYHAQVAYVVSHNGGEQEQAKVWSLLLDTGAAGLSLLRLFEALMRRSGIATRLSLAGCIAGSVTMNLLHTPSRTLGGYIVAAVPPVMYAVFLEHLLTKVRGALVGEEKRRNVWHAAALWINFPRTMWSGWRASLRCDAEYLTAPKLPAERAPVTAPEPCLRSGPAVQKSINDAPKQHAQSSSLTRRGRGPGAKRLAFEAALVEQLRTGDMRMLSADERERNAAAYQAAASLPAPLAKGTARRYVVQALPRLCERQ